jgi:hypothetical protein
MMPDNKLVTSVKLQSHRPARSCCCVYYSPVAVCTTHLFCASDSVRAFKEKMKMGQFKEVDPEEKKRQEEERKQQEKAEEEKAKTIAVGDR